MKYCRICGGAVPRIDDAQLQEAYSNPAEMDVGFQNLLPVDVDTDSDSDEEVYTEDEVSTDGEYDAEDIGSPFNEYVSQFETYDDPTENYSAYMEALTFTEQQYPDGIPDALGEILNNHFFP